MMMTIPFGCAVCDHCAAVSAVYEPFATCRECRDTICYACAVDGSWEVGDAVTAVCRTCVEGCEHIEEQQAPHVCPYRSEVIGHAEALCTCCKDCVLACAQDI